MMIKENGQSVQLELQSRT